MLTKTKRIVLNGAAMLMLGGFGQQAFAHASILNAINSGTTGFSRVGLNHACNATSPPTPIVAQSVVFPTINPILSRSDNGSIVSLTDFIATTASGTRTVNNQVVDAGITTLAGLPQLVQSKDVFTKQVEQRNGSDPATALVIGWVSTKGMLGVNLHGEVPFRFGAVHFRPTLPAANPNGMQAKDLCAKSLRIQVAVADICNVSQVPPMVNHVNGGFNIWVSNLTPGLDASGYPFPPASIENGAGTPVLTVNRDVAVNPYPANCVPAGGSDPTFDVNVWPSAQDIEKLQYPGWGTADPANFL